MLMSGSAHNLPQCLAGGKVERCLAQTIDICALRSTASLPFFICGPIERLGSVLAEGCPSKHPAGLGA